MGKKLVVTEYTYKNYNMKIYVNILYLYVDQTKKTLFIKN